MYALFCIICFHRSNWPSPTTLTEVFRWLFLSCKPNSRAYLARNGSRWALFLITEMYINVYCTIATGWQHNCS